MDCNFKHIKIDMFVHFGTVRIIKGCEISYNRPFCMMIDIEDAAPSIYKKMNIELKELMGIFAFKEIKFFDHHLIVLN